MILSFAAMMILRLDLRPAPNGQSLTDNRWSVFSWVWEFHGWFFS